MKLLKYYRERQNPMLNVGNDFLFIHPHCCMREDAKLPITDVESMQGSSAVCNTERANMTISPARVAPIEA